MVEQGGEQAHEGGDGNGSETPCEITVTGIRVYFCVGEKQKKVWVDLDEVEALTWCTNKDIPEKPKGPTSSGRKIPRGSKPGKCKDTDDFNGDPGSLCWYNGTEWVCGTVE